MSEPFHCEVCRKEGRRRMMKMVPEGWFYAEAYIQDADTGDIKDILVLGVCSEECKAKFWNRGPGKLEPGIEKQPHVEEPQPGESDGGNSQEDR